MNIRFTATALLFTALFPTTIQAQQPEAFILTVTGQEVSLIGQALGDQPYKTAAPLINKLNEQIAKQISEAAKAKSPEADTKKPEDQK